MNTLLDPLIIASSALLGKKSNLEVAHDHTFTVGMGEWVVHNSNGQICGDDVNFDSKQVQEKYKHASDFGVTGNYNKVNAARFQQAIRDFIDAPTTNEISGTYRGQPATHFFDPATNQDVIIDPNNNFISGWRLSIEQIRYLLTRGNVQ